MATAKELAERMAAQADKHDSLVTAISAVSPQPYQTRPMPDLSGLLRDIGRNPLVLSAEANYASEFYKRLTAWIKGFDASLDDAHEVGVRLVSFVQTVVFRLENMGYWNPSLLSFEGHTEDGDPVELIQHVSQISILLTTLRRPDPTIPKEPIGFASLMETDEKVAAVSGEEKEEKVSG